MSRLAKALLGVLAFILIVGSLAWVNRTELLLKGIEILAERRRSIGPHQAVDWDSGTCRLTTSELPSSWFRLGTCRAFPRGNLLLTS